VIIACDKRGTFFCDLALANGSRTIATVTQGCLSRYVTDNVGGPAYVAARRMLARLS
jgi:hypothetical protein